MTRRSIAKVLTITLLFLLVGCSQKEDENEESQSDSTFSDRSSHSQQSTISTEEKRIKLPFDRIVADVDFQIPPGTDGKLAGDGRWPSSMVYDPPVHPLGNIRSLRIEDQEVALKTTQLKDGMLLTRDFGEFEVLLIGPGQSEIRATQAQINKIWEWLLKIGGSTDATRWLIEAAAEGRTETIKALLKRNIEVDAKNAEGVTALWVAAQKGHTDIIKLLLENKADVNAKDAEGSSTALMMAAWKGHIESVKTLLESKADVNARESTGITALWVAVGEGHKGVVKVLLEAGAEVNAGRSRMTPLFLAAQEGHTEIVKLLLKEGAEVNTKCKTQGVTALTVAVVKNYTEIVSALLESKADVNAKSNDGSTALMMAVLQGHTEIVKLLLEGKADFNAKAQMFGKDYTPLRMAEVHGHAEIVRLLTEYGAEK